MNLHALSTQCGRRLYSLGSVTTALGIVALLLLLLGAKVAFAQTPPVAVGQSVTTAEDTAIEINTTIAVDAGGPGGASRYQLAVITPGPSHGSVAEVLPRTGTYKIRYTPGANRTDAVLFDYQLCTINTPLVCGTKATVIVTITPVNDGPVAGADSATVKQGQSVLINVLANDNGGLNENDTVALVPGSVSTPASGTAAIEGNQIRYTAGNVCGGPVTFSYLVQDSAGLQAAGTVTVNVTCPGTPGIELSAPYAFSNHTFKVDVLLKSSDVNVAAVDFVLTYDTCVADTDTPANGLADDVTSTLGNFGFTFAVQDLPASPPALRFVAAKALNNEFLAGPTTPTRTLATLLLMANPGCSATSFTFTNPTFTGENGSNLPNGGSTQNYPNAPLTTVNNKPTNITLSNATLPEGSPSGTLVGILSTTDPDASDAGKHNYTFAAPAFDNANFQFNPFANSELQLVNPLLVAGSYKVTIASTDPYNGFITKTLTIEITDVNVAPNAIDDYVPVLGRTVLNTLLGNDNDASDNPPDPACTNCSIQSVTNGLNGTVTNQGLSVIYMPTNAKAITDVFTYMLTDNDASGPKTDTANVYVTIQKDAVGGDCNKNGYIEAGDLTATGLEIFDGDGSAWYNIYQGSYKDFALYGCNSNQDAVVDAGDVPCTVKKLFSSSFVCGNTLLAASASSATLAVSPVSAAPGATVEVPVVLTTSGYPVAAAAFALDFNDAEVSFDTTDADNDGIPDAVHLKTPSNLQAIVAYNADESRIEIVVMSLMSPFPLLPDGTVATVSLTVKEDISATASTIALVNSSLGSDEGQSVPLEVTDGAIQVVTQPASRILLPLILSR